MHIGKLQYICIVSFTTIGLFICVCSKGALELGTVKLVVAVGSQKGKDGLGVRNNVIARIER